MLFLLPLFKCFAKNCQNLKHTGCSQRLTIKPFTLINFRYSTVGLYYTIYGIYIKGLFIFCVQYYFHLLILVFDFVFLECFPIFFFSHFLNFFGFFPFSQVLFTFCFYISNFSPFSFFSLSLFLVRL